MTFKQINEIKIFFLCLKFLRVDTGKDAKLVYSILLQCEEVARHSRFFRLTVARETSLVKLWAEAVIKLVHLIAEVDVDVADVPYSNRAYENLQQVLQQLEEVMTPTTPMLTPGLKKVATMDKRKLTFSRPQGIREDFLLLMLRLVSLHAADTPDADAVFADIR